MPGARRRVLLQKARSLDEGRIHGTGGCIQLLSGQEPWCLRRSRSSDHERCRPGRQRSRMLRDHGQAKKYLPRRGRLQRAYGRDPGGLLHAKLSHLAGWKLSVANARPNTTGCWPAMRPLLLPYEPSWSRAVYHLYVVRTNDRDGLMNHLKKAGIGTGIHYPIPLHLQKAYASLKYSQGDFPWRKARAARNHLLANVPATYCRAAAENCRAGPCLQFAR